MPPKRRHFRRPLGKRPYRKLFVIAVEGSKTEPLYFSLFDYREAVLQVKCLRGKHQSAPRQVLRRMENHLREESLRATDEAWLVVDKDQWSDEQLAELHAWSLGHDHYGFALSNPKFEYWLLLHFEDGVSVSSSRECSARLRRHLPGYDKAIDVRKITTGMIEVAIKRAKERDLPPCEDWPRQTGTTVYRLVEKLMH